jgi:hypothetical protein
MSERPNLWVVSIHESAHAIVRLALGLRVRRLIVEPNGAGLCEFAPLYAYHDTDSLILLRHVVCALAGNIAQERFTQGGGSIEHGGSADRAGARQLAMLIDENEATEILERAQAMAVQLVRTHRHAIFSLAAQLYQRAR